MPRLRVICSQRHLTRSLRAFRVTMLVLTLSLTPSVFAQSKLPSLSHSHRLVDSNQPPGTLGYLRSIAGNIDPSYFQPVRIIAPEGVQVGAAENDASGDTPSPALFGLQVGKPYRFRLSQAGLYAGVELYPSIELIDRVFPPAGMETRFAIPIEFTDEELRMASYGEYIVRIVFVEDPELALPLAEIGYSGQRAIDVAEDQDPLAVADEYGRPIAVIRIGSKAPGPEGPDESFLFGSPLLQQLEPIAIHAETRRAPTTPDPSESPLLTNRRLRRMNK